jgi:hypothetical protein
MNYDKLIKDINTNFDIQIERRDRSLGMVNHFHPLSITQREFDYIQSFIIKHNLQVAFDMATAWGASALAAGLGMKETGGRVVSMDAYIEENYNHCGAYGLDKEIYENMDGYRLAHFLSDFYKTPAVFEVGWSPDDTEKNLSKHYNFKLEKLDYVFIDAGHWPAAVIRDIEAIIPFLAEKYVIFLHDVFCFDQSVINFLQQKLGRSWIECFPRNEDQGQSGHYWLSQITNLE